MNQTERLIMVPSDPLFYSILHGTLPPNFTGDQCLISRSGSGVVEAVSPEEAWEYALGGEFEEWEQEEEDLINGLGFD